MQKLLWLKSRTQGIFKINREQISKQKMKFTPQFPSFSILKFMHLALLFIVLPPLRYLFLNAGWRSASLFVNVVLLLDTSQLIKYE